MLEENVVGDLKGKITHRLALRAGFFLVIASAGLLVGADYALTSSSQVTYEGQSQLPYDERAQVAPEANGITVIAEHPADRLIAFSPDGRLLYYNDSLDRYHDVDPVPGTEATVEYVALKHTQDCDSETACGVNVVERVNLSTGDVDRVYSRTVPARLGSTYRWHDVDRIDAHRLLVADIEQDRVFITNATTGEIEYSWEAISDFPISGGGRYPSDWTHLNDVELLDDGRIMVSLRNQDQVVFLQPGKGVQEEWTLGGEDNHSTLYEQHNPDYIPEQRGGPAVLVADSENNRIIEYQRTEGGEWEQTWTWADKRLSWGRDADRLPNGNTLIADTYGSRVLEVNQSGDVVWQVGGVVPYEAERLGTGDESTGGKSAAEIGITSRTVGEESDSENDRSLVKRIVMLPGELVWGLIPVKGQHTISFVLPAWIGGGTGGYVVAACLTAVFWAGAELVWAPYSLKIVRGD